MTDDRELREQYDRLRQVALCLIPELDPRRLLPNETPDDRLDYLIRCADRAERHAEA